MKPADPVRNGGKGTSPVPLPCPPSRPVSSRYKLGYRPGLHSCRIGQTRIFLDIPADRYFALTGQAADHVCRLLSLAEGDRLPDELRASFARFRELDLLRPMSGPETGHRPNMRPPPIGSAFAASSPAPDRLWPSALPLFSAGCATLFLTRMRAFKSCVDAARSWTGGNVSGDNLLYEAIDQARAFHRIMPYLFSRHDACLFRSLFLLRYLHARGIAADWEFGVRLSPFCAHCWVEYEGIVLNDHQDTILAYTKILSVREPDS